MHTNKTYYNEFDKKKCQAMALLMAEGIIPDGDIDDRPIQEVKADDVKGYTQCHFFAGWGGWAYALGLAGWETSRPVWTGSCPCQPFSSAGRQKGKGDERHLWPEWLRLIRECRPPVIFGEQVASAIGPEPKNIKEMHRLRDKQAIIRILQAQGIVSGSSDILQSLLSCNGICSEGGDARRGFICSTQAMEKEEQGERFGEFGEASGEGERSDLFDIGGRNSATDRSWILRTDQHPVQSGGWQDVGQPISGSARFEQGLHTGQRESGSILRERDGEHVGREQDIGNSSPDTKGTQIEKRHASGEAGKKPKRVTSHGWLDDVYQGLEAEGYAVGSAVLPACGVGAPHKRDRLWFVADHEGDRRDEWEQEHGGRSSRIRPWQAERPADYGSLGDGDGQGPQRRTILSERADERSPWSPGVEWLQCADGKQRLVKPGIQLLADGYPNRRLLLHIAGDSIVPQVAAAFIGAYMDARP